MTASNPPTPSSCRSMPTALGCSKRPTSFTAVWPEESQFSPGYPDPVAREFIRRGVPYEDEAARSVRQLRSLGFETIDQIPGSVLGTEDEGPVDRKGVRQGRPE